jgi:hypothetical protein
MYLSNKADFFRLAVFLNTMLSVDELKYRCDVEKNEENMAR